MWSKWPVSASRLAASEVFVVPAKKRFNVGDVVCDRHAPLVPLYVLSRDTRGRLTVTNAAGEQFSIGSHFVEDYVEKLCAAERQLMSQRIALASLLQAAPPELCSVHARAHAALAPAPAPPPQQKSVAKRRLDALMAPPPPPRTRRPKKPSASKKHAHSRALPDLLGIGSSHGKPPSRRKVGRDSDDE